MHVKGQKEVKRWKNKEHTLAGHQGCIAGCRPSLGASEAASPIRVACANRVYELPCRAECPPEACPLASADYARIRARAGLRQDAPRQKFASDRKVTRMGCAVDLLWARKLICARCSWKTCDRQYLSDVPVKKRQESLLLDLVTVRLSNKFRQLVPNRLFVLSSPSESKVYRDDETDEGRLDCLTDEKSRAQTLRIPSRRYYLGNTPPTGRSGVDFIFSAGHQPCTCWASRRLFSCSTVTLWASVDEQYRCRCR